MFGVKVLSVLAVSLTITTLSACNAVDGGSKMGGGPLGAISNNESLKSEPVAVAPAAPNIAVPTLTAQIQAINAQTAASPNLQISANEVADLGQEGLLEDSEDQAALNALVTE